MSAETKGLTLEEVRATFEREVGTDGSGASTAAAAAIRRGEYGSDGSGLRDGYHVIGHEEDESSVPDPDRLAEEEEEEGEGDHEHDGEEAAAEEKEEEEQDEATEEAAALVGAVEPPDQGTSK